jgi:hypothetical protein
MLIEPKSCKSLKFIIFVMIMMPMKSIPNSKHLTIGE